MQLHHEGMEARIGISHSSNERARVVPKGVKENTVDEGNGILNTVSMSPRVRITEQVLT